MILNVVLYDALVGGRLGRVVALEEVERFVTGYDDGRARLLSFLFGTGGAELFGATAGEVDGVCIVAIDAVVVAVVAVVSTASSSPAATSTLVVSTGFRAHDCLLLFEKSWLWYIAKIVSR